VTSPRSRRQALVSLVGVSLLAIGSVGEATAPASRYTFPVLNGISTVTDGKTTLSWQRANSDAISPHGPTQRMYTWAEAQAYCDALGPGFRLPSLKELQTLVDEGTSRPALDTGAFPNGPESAYYWTSSPFARDNSLAWVVNVGVGNTLGQPVGSTLRVRCVR